MNDMSMFELTLRRPHTGWAMAGNTPFRYFTQSEHRGGRHDPLVVHWPKGIKAKGETMSGLARAIEKQGRDAEAEQLYGEVLEISQRVSGAAHPGTLSTKAGMARAIEKQGRYSEAEELLREVLKISQSVLGPDLMAQSSRVDRQPGPLRQCRESLSRGAGYSDANLGSGAP